MNRKYRKLVLHKNSLYYHISKEKLSSFVKAIQIWKCWQDFSTDNKNESKII
jgi:hypothetical protein